MKCQHCGNNLNIEDKFCPYCGQPNPYAVKHQEEMERYEKDYQETREEVLEKSSRFNRRTVRITILAVLVALIAVTGFVMAKADDIRWLQLERAVEQQAPMHREAIAELMESEDFLGVYSYMTRNRITYTNSLREFDAVYDTTSRYRSFYENLMTLQEKKKGAENYGYYSETDILADISRNISDIYEYMQPQEYNKEAYEEDKMEYMEALRDHMEAMVSGYFGLTPEEVKGMRSMTESRINVMLEDRYEQENN
jgi:hypothetical protein